MATEDHGHRQASAAEPLLLVILGPTASGKTALSLTLAEEFEGEIINCDSVAMVRDCLLYTSRCV